MLASCAAQPTLAVARKQQIGPTRRLHCSAAKGDGGSGWETSSSGSNKAGSKAGGKPGSKPGSSRRFSGSRQRPGGAGSSGARRPPPQQPKQQQPKQAAKQQEQCLVPPLQTLVVRETSASERMPAPLWGTFCGVSNGLWVGLTAAYSPFTGQPEPLALNEQRKPITLLHQCCVEQRVFGEDGQDTVVRHVARAASHEGLQREMAQGGQLHFPACSATPASDGAVAECWDEERMSAEQEGLVVFDGGSYSLGPAAIGSPAELPEQAAIAFDDEAAAEAAARLEAALAAIPAVDSIELLGQSEGEVEGEEGASEEEGSVEVPDVVALAAKEQAEFDWTAVVIEHCMQWGGEQRLRIKLTLDTAGGGDGTDLEVQPLRVTVSREAWEGLPGSYTPVAQGAGAAEQQEASRQVRLDAATLAGSWKVFEVSAVTVDDISMQTGLPTLSTLYTAHATLRAFDARPGKDGGDGALLLLPHSCGIQLETLLLDNTGRRGLRVATHWSPQPGMLLTTARLYDADGRLLEVSTATAIRDEPHFSP